MKLLIALDGSKGSKKALDYAIKLAGKTKASLMLLHVVDTTALAAPGLLPTTVAASPVLMETKDLLKRAATDMVNSAAAFCRKKGLRATTAVRTGRPTEEIVREAKQQKADMIVVSSHGRSAAAAALLGSVALGVIHRSGSIPVLVVRK